MIHRLWVYLTRDRRRRAAILVLQMAEADFRAACEEYAQRPCLSTFLMAEALRDVRDDARKAADAIT